MIHENVKDPRVEQARSVWALLFIWSLSFVCLNQNSPDRPERPAGSYALRITVVAMAAYFSIMLSMFLGGSEREDGLTAEPVAEYKT